MRLLNSQYLNPLYLDVNMRPLLLSQSFESFADTVLNESTLPSSAVSETSSQQMLRQLRSDASLSEGATLTLACRVLREQQTSDSPSGRAAVLRLLKSLSSSTKSACKQLSTPADDRSVVFALFS